MEDNVCKASLETIASDLGIDKATVQRHADKLCDLGYLKDLTPELRNRPHVYVDTGKLQIKASVTVAHGNTDVAHGNVTVAESQLNKVLKKDINKEHSQLDETFGSRDIITNRADRIVKAVSGYEEQQGSVEKALEVLTGRRIASKNKSIMSDIADLREWGATPQTLVKFEHYWTVEQGWRGKPTVRQVWELWETAMKWTPPTGNVKSDKYSPLRRPGVMPTVLK